MALDPRIVKVGIEVDGVLRIYEDAWISASGTKYANATQDECTVSIANLRADVREDILTSVSPFNSNKTAKTLILYAGRESTGAAEIFRGNITTASQTQPPDIMLNIKAKTGDAQKGNIIAVSQPGTQSLEQIAKKAASDIGASLSFEATSKSISNYSFTGGALKQIDKIGEAGSVDAFLDGNVLHVKNRGSARSGTARILNKSSGMIGQPEIDEKGVKVTYLLDATSKIGGSLIIESEYNKSASGTYEIYKLSFNASNRDTPFYWIASAKR